MRLSCQRKLGTLLVIEFNTLEAKNLRTFDI